MSTIRKTLSEGDKIGYSERERQLFKAVAGRVKISTSDLVDPRLNLGLVRHRASSHHSLG